MDLGRATPDSAKAVAPPPHGWRLLEQQHREDAASPPGTGAWADLPRRPSAWLRERRARTGLCHADRHGPRDADTGGVSDAIWLDELRGCPKTLCCNSCGECGPKRQRGMSVVDSDSLADASGHIACGFTALRFKAILFGQPLRGNVGRVFIESPARAAKLPIDSTAASHRLLSTE